MHIRKKNLETPTSIPIMHPIVMAKQRHPQEFMIGRIKHKGRCAYTFSLLLVFPKHYKFICLQWGESDFHTVLRH